MGHGCGYLSPRLRGGLVVIKKQTRDNGHRRCPNTVQKPLGFSQKFRYSSALYVGGSRELDYSKGIRLFFISRKNKHFPEGKQSTISQTDFSNTKYI